MGKRSDLLKPDVQAVLFEPVGGIEVYWQRARVTVVLMRKLERIASMDALAVLTWLLRESIVQGSCKNTERLAHSIYTVLLIMGIEWQNRDLAECAAQAICAAHSASGFAAPSAVLHERGGYA